jgi:hypothetical protein
MHRAVDGPASANESETGVGQMIDSIAVIDVDTHVTEPPDRWTSRMPTIADNLAELPDDIRRKVRPDTAARIYKLDV